MEVVGHLFRRRRVRDRRSKTSHTRRGIRSLPQRGMQPVRPWGQQPSEHSSRELGVGLPWDYQKVQQDYWAEPSLGSVWVRLSLAYRVS